MNEQRMGYIYVLIDPITNVPKYVGKSLSPLYKTLSRHFRDKRSTYKVRWIQSLYKKYSLKPIIKIIEECNEIDLNSREIFWIAEYKKEYVLCNLTDGGDGLPIGFKHTAETKEKIRLAAIKQPLGKFTKEYRGNREVAINAVKIYILQYDLMGNFIKEWKGVIDTGKALNINCNLISRCLKNRSKSAGGFMWKYKTDNYKLKIDEYKREYYSGKNLRDK